MKALWIFQRVPLLSPVSTHWVPVSPDHQRIRLSGQILDYLDRWNTGLQNIFAGSKAREWWTKGLINRCDRRLRWNCLRYWGSHCQTWRRYLVTLKQGREKSNSLGCRYFTDQLRSYHRGCPSRRDEDWYVSSSSRKVMLTWPCLFQRMFYPKHFNRVWNHTQNRRISRSPSLSSQFLWACSPHLTSHWLTQALDWVVSQVLPKIQFHRERQ